MRQAYNTLKHDRRRSILTMLGIARGIATVVLLLAYGTSSNAACGFFPLLGHDLVFIFPGRTSLQAGGPRRAARSNSPSTISITFRPRCPCSSAFRRGFQAKHRRLSDPQRDYGIGGVYPFIGTCAAWTSKTALSSLTWTRNARHVAILGADVRKNCLRADALSEKVKVDSILRGHRRSHSVMQEGDDD